MRCQQENRMRLLDSRQHVRLNSSSSVPCGVLHCWRRRSVRPLGHWNHELGHWLRSTIKVCIQQNRGAGRVCTPSHSVFQGNVEHEMGKPVPGAVVKVSLLGQHIGHSARLEGRQFFVLNRGLHTLVDFIFRFSSQCQFCPHQSDRQHRSCCWWIKANRASILRVPKLGTVFE